MTSRDKPNKPRSDRPKAATDWRLGYAASGPIRDEAAFARQRQPKLDGDKWKVPLGRFGTTLTPEQIKEKAARGELGTAEMPDNQIW